MKINHRERLASIHRFDQFVAYLRDELEWPIESSDFEEMTFEYTPEELGIDAKNAAKIQTIQQLRPHTVNQPWGIFFVKFEPRRLPVVALRRILSRVVLKKRISANSSERQAWAAHDLLFISNYGEGEQREIALAHFSEPHSGNGLPTLKVLGWNSLDTPLHLDAIVEELTSNLAWPENEDDIEEWRERWCAAFKLQHREVIRTSKQLSEHLAKLAQAVRDRINSVLNIEAESGPITMLMKAFQTTFSHDLDQSNFADTYAQTIAYGLLSTRITNPAQGSVDELTNSMQTNPFLRELLDVFLRVSGRYDGNDGTNIDFDELGVSEIVDLLDQTNMEAVIRDFGDRNPQEDPVIHFYEHFLEAYDKQQKVKRGVFYTPRPVVTYIVRSVDELLRNEFGLVDGLADTTTWREMAKRKGGLKIPDGVSPNQEFVQILDPATGTGTFLVESIELIHRTMKEKWRSQGQSSDQIQKLWNEYVPKHLLSRLYGYELLMAPYAIAHLKISLKLYETGYRFENNENARARVYLTNALNPPSDGQTTVDFLPALAQEVIDVNKVKSEQRFTVVIGNPPYSGVSVNNSQWIDNLLRGRDDGSFIASSSGYYQVDGEPLKERKLWLQDDYVKFIRLSQWLIDCTGVGIHGYISNHGYLDNITFRGMRWSILESFQQVHTLDLHGNLKKKEVPPMGGQDSNVFDIQQGVAIGLFVKKPYGVGAVYNADLWGERVRKNSWLQNHSYLTTKWVELEQTPPYFMFKPLDLSGVEDYFKWPKINELMTENVSGILTARDRFVVDFDSEALLNRIKTFLDFSLGDEIVKKRLNLSENYAWRVEIARRELHEATKTKHLKDFVKRILYRSFDERFIFWHPSVVWRPRLEVLSHMIETKNIALIVCRQQARSSDDWAQVFVTSKIAESCTISNTTREINYLFPLYLCPGVGKIQNQISFQRDSSEISSIPNLDSQFIDRLEEATKLQFIGNRSGDLRQNFSALDVFSWIYAVLHSPSYRRRYDAPLKLDFPRVPLPSKTNIFRELVKLGHELLDYHLLDSPRLEVITSKYVGPSEPLVERVGWSAGTVWLNAVKVNAADNYYATRPGTIGFEGVTKDVWNFNIGGYQVCHKWLKDRKGRILSENEIVHYKNIVVAVDQTISLMAQIDKVIESHGSWSKAFQT